MDEKRAARIEALLHTPAWGELTEELEQAEQKFWRRHVADIKDGKPLNQRELDYMRGKLDGLRVILNQPQRAHRVMERAKEEELKSEV